MMINKIIELIASAVKISTKQVENTIALLDEGATIPFIARYRKERTGSLDEVVVSAIADQYTKLQELEKRKATILSTIEEQKKLTPELKLKIEQCFELNILEDIYLPYKPKRRTKATIAREKGLEPLAKQLMSCRLGDPEREGHRFVKGDVKNVDEALAGARDIIAEWVSENSVTRDMVRTAYSRSAVLTSKVAKGKTEEAAKYKDYFEWDEPLKRSPSHRFLAMQRGQNEGLLKLSIDIDQEEQCDRLDRFYTRGAQNECSNHISTAVKDSLKRLICPSLETEFTNSSKARADEEAIQVFGNNLKQLLLASPLGQKNVLAIDPGFRTGCKVVCLDAQGNLKKNTTIYPHPPQKNTTESAEMISQLVLDHSIDAIAIGDGTAGRETEQFINGLGFEDVDVFMVNEDGASIYSASKIARDEFPDDDITVRGAVSIGRRLMDPLAELVKIDAKSIGVGQYQHDVDQKKLQQELDRVVESAVNQVGVNLNTASKHLLLYVSGLGPQLADNIVKYRAEHGAFTSRRQLLKVPRMGAKAYEQSAGFLRIPQAENVLDQTAVHPESYGIVQTICKDKQCTVDALVQNGPMRKSIQLEKYITKDVGLPTLVDIMKELEKPGRDPRSKIEVFRFSEGFSSIDDLHEGVTVNGIVTNVTKFGAFVDFGIKENGLIHVSEMANRFISDPSQVVSLREHVRVKIISIDRQRRRIQLSIKQADQ